MRSALVLTALVVANFALGSCQIQFGGFLARRHGDHVESHSFFSSSSWGVRQDGSEVKKNIVCQDGACKEVVQVKSAPQTEERPMLMPAYQQPFFRPGQMETQRSRLRGIMERLMQRMQQPHQQEQEVIIQRMPMRPMYPDRIPQPPKIIEIEIARPQHVYVPQQAPNPASASDMNLLKIGVALCALAAAYAMVMSVLKCYRSDQTSARERPLRELAEPFAAAPVNAALPAAAPVASRKKDIVPVYLTGLYSRVTAKIEARSVKMYLERLYTRQARK